MADSNTNKASRAMTALWILTGAVTLALAVATVWLFQQGSSSEDLVGKQVFLASEEQLVLLRDSARINAQVTAILETGTSVKITEIDTTTVRPWVYVESEFGSGWVEAANVSETPPLP